MRARFELVNVAGGDNGTAASRQERRQNPEASDVVRAAGYVRFREISGDGGREVRDEVDEVKRSAVEPTCRNSIAFGGVSLLLGVWRSCVVPGSGQSKC